MYVDHLIVGAGFTGSIIAERLASQCGKKVLVVDKRHHVAGNAYDAEDENGILVHRYGPHIFHTNSRNVLNYLSRFTSWRRYEHRVLASVKGQLIPVPFNLDSLDRLVGGRQARAMTSELLQTYGEDAEIPILRLRSSGSRKLRQLADLVYEQVFLGYTRKQWGLTPEELDRSVTARVPLRVSRDDRYFRDRFQVMPADGYTAMFERMLDHPNIDVSLNTEYGDVAGSVKYGHLVYTGKIDAFFDYVHGFLPYRSLSFVFSCVDRPHFQPVAQVNYPNVEDYTRITEMKYLTGQHSDNTTIAMEYPEAHRVGENEPYYPVPRRENNTLYECYREEAERLAGRVLFAGRLADYRYYNMDQAAARALMLFEKLLRTS